MRLRALVLVAGLVAGPGAAHDWSEMSVPPDVLLERLVEIIEDGRAAGQFSAPLSPDCVPHHCMKELL